MGDEGLPVLGAATEPSPSAKLMAAVSQTGMSSDEAYHYLDSHDALRAHQSAVKLRKLAALYRAFRSQHMGYVAEGFEQAAELIDPEGQS
jgi:hypothetical protein